MASPHTVRYDYTKPNENVLVDFEQKQWNESDRRDMGFEQYEQQFYHRDVEHERARQLWEANLEREEGL